MKYHHLTDLQAHDLLEFIRSCTDDEIEHCYENNGEEVCFNPGYAVGSSAQSPKERARFNHSIFNALPNGYKTSQVHEASIMKNLLGLGLVVGCLCGCNGKFEITDAGRLKLNN